MHVAEHTNENASVVGATKALMSQPTYLKGRKRMNHTDTNLVPSQSAPAIFSFGERQVRIVVRDGEPWFVANDVATALDYRSAWNLTRILDDDEKGTHIVSTLGGEQQLLVINEPGLYSAVISSRKPEAKAFKRWITNEVLPSIRKTGRYELPQELTPAQQHEAQERVKQRVCSNYEKPMQATVFAQMWGGIKRHFKVGSYKQVPSSRFGELLEYIDTMELPKPEVSNIMRYMIDPQYEQTRKGLSAAQEILGAVSTALCGVSDVSQNAGASRLLGVCQGMLKEANDYVDRALAA